MGIRYEHWTNDRPISREIARSIVRALRIERAAVAAAIVERSTIDRQDVARRMTRPVSVVNQWFEGNANPRLATLFALADELDVELVPILFELWVD